MRRRRLVDYTKKKEKTIPSSESSDFVSQVPPGPRSRIPKRKPVGGPYANNFGAGSPTAQILRERDVEDVTFKLKPRIRMSKRLEGLSSSPGRLSDEDAEPATTGGPHAAFVSNRVLWPLIPRKKLAIRHLISTLDTILPSPTTVVDDEWLFPLGISNHSSRQHPPGSHIGRRSPGVSAYCRKERFVKRNEIPTEVYAISPSIRQRLRVSADSSQGDSTDWPSSPASTSPLSRSRSDFGGSRCLIKMQQQELRMAALEDTCKRSYHEGHSRNPTLLALRSEQQLSWIDIEDGPMASPSRNQKLGS
jgi:hypothetical protein